MKAINRDEIIWASGFFDGEGNARYREIQTTKVPIVQISQTDRGLLERFQKAVLGLGTIRGPYKHKNPNAKPYFRYYVGNFESVQAIAAMLWPFLSPAKRAQFKSTLEKLIY